MNSNGSWFVSTETESTRNHTNAFFCGRSSTLTASTNSINLIEYFTIFFYIKLFSVNSITACSFTNTATKSSGTSVLFDFPTTTTSSSTHAQTTTTATTSTTYDPTTTSTSSSTTYVLPGIY